MCGAALVGGSPLGKPPNPRGVFHHRAKQGQGARKGVLFPGHGGVTERAMVCLLLADFQ